MQPFRNYKTLIVPAAVGAFLVWLADRSIHTRTGSGFLPAALLDYHGILLSFFFFVGFLAYGSLIGKKRGSISADPGLHSAVLEESLDGIAIYDRDNVSVFVNQAYAVMNGYESASELTGKPYSITYDDHELSRMERVMAPVLRKTGKWRGELLARRKNGSTFFQEASVTMLEDGGWLYIIRDITWRKRSEDRMHRSERFLNTIFDSIRDPFCIFDTDFRIIRVNEAYSKMKNKRVDELIGKKCYEVFEGRRDACKGCVVAKTFHSADPCAKDKQVLLAEGTRIWVEIYTYPIMDDEGLISHVIEYTRDGTERKKSEEEKRRLIENLERLSRTDSLTGLMNRRALTENLTYEIDRAKRYGSDLSLVLCDMDSFKEINDRHGHDTGDRALQLLSKAFESIIRKSDIAGRFGGDEFMLILPETNIGGAESLAFKILSDLKLIDLRSADGRPIPLSMSIGVASMAGADDSIDSLIKRADDAMYASKQGGRSRVTTPSSL